MAYFDDRENVQQYVQMSEGYDGREFIPILRKYLKDGARVLELGMGPGKDLLLLSRYFQVVGSDASRVFLDRYRQVHPEADLVRLDAVTMDIDRKFDCIYSNKVLPHLSKEELERSLRKQVGVLNDGGILFHTFWHGDRQEVFSGLRFVYYTQASFSRIVGREYKIVEWKRYTEVEEDDSFYVVLARDGGRKGV